jgi:hypothetical protein
MDADATVELLREILADLPRLPGARCIGKHVLFDPVPGNGGHQHRRQEQIRLAEAARVCAGCPVIGRCTTVTTIAVTVEVVPAPRRPGPPPGVLPAA